MTEKFDPGVRSGCINVPDSKSLLHRHFICKAFSSSEIPTADSNDPEDLQATLNCLNRIFKLNDRTDISNFPLISKPIHLYCGESGTTLRFLLPVAAALGIEAVFHMTNNLAVRPHHALLKVLNEHGAKITHNHQSMRLSGKLMSGQYIIPGNISSQFISGLLFALPLLENDSQIIITTEVQSVNYIRMTESVLSCYNINFEKSGNTYHIPGNQSYTLSQETDIEKDWSAAAFFLCMGAFSEQGIFVKDLKISSLQGDCAVLEILKKFGANIAIHSDGIKVCKGNLIGQRICAKNIPDLVPPLAVLAAVSRGTTLITGAERLHYKESDRLKSTTAMLKTLGAKIRETKIGLMIEGKPALNGGCIDPFNDHRIAMAAAEAASICREPVIIKNADCVRKSFPDFWTAINSLSVRNTEENSESSHNKQNRRYQ